jgi:hypothetical protein
LNTATYYKWSNPTSVPPGITVTNLGFSPSGGRSITSINLDPNNSNVAMITMGNYGSTNYVYKGTNMLGSPTYTNITGNLPSMPVYDGFIDVNNANRLFVGTDIGVYASDDGGATWTSQNTAANGFPKVATMALRQYIYPGRFRGSIYAGTHGRGFFECQQFKTSIADMRSSKGAQIITAYPNPANEQANLKFNTKSIEDVTVTVYDVTGKTVFTKVFSSLSAGEQNLVIETGGIQAGSYIVTAKGTNTNAVLRLVVRH